jgi:hypothetical protein
MLDSIRRTGARGTGKRQRLWRSLIAVTLRDLWLDRLTPDDPPRSWPRAFLYTVLAFAAALAVVGTGWLYAPQPLQHDGHALMSLNLAMRRAFCGMPSAYDPTIDIPGLIVRQPEYDRVPLRQFAATMAGSLDEFCARSHPFLTNEDSLMLLESAVLRLDERTSVTTLFVVFHSLRLLLVGVFLLGLLRSGASLLIAVPAAAVALECQRMLELRYAHAMYPFILPLVLGVIGLYAAAWHLLRRGSLKWVLAVTAALGFYAAFVANMRSEYVPLLFAFHVLIVLRIGTMPAAVPGSRHRRALAVAAPFAATYLAFQAAFIWTLPSTGFNYASHPVAHPLVLGLAYPPNALAQREGIEWNDGAGLPLARRVDPNATYLGPTYEHALMTYYWQLWHEHPAEMRAIYQAKADIAGPHAVKSLRAIQAWNPYLRKALGTLRGVTSGLIFLGLFAAVGCVGLVALVVRRWAVGLPLVLIMGGASYVLIQSIIIMPYFYPQYHGLLLVGLVMLPVLALQAMLDGAFAVSTWLAGRRAMPVPSLAEQP